MTFKLQSLFQFSIATLLVVMAIVCGFIGGRQTGYRHGFLKGQSNWSAMPTTSRVYRMRPALIPPPSIASAPNIRSLEAATAKSPELPATYAAIISRLDGEIIPKDWYPELGPSLSGLQPGNRITVVGNSMVHLELQNYFQYLEKENEQAWAVYAARQQEIAEEKELALQKAIAAEEEIDKQEEAQLKLLEEALGQPD